MLTRNKSMKNHKGKQDLRAEYPRLGALGKSIRITFIYLTVGCLWIVFSDLIVESIFRELSSITLVSIAKGVFYVVATAVMIFCLVYPALQRAMSAQQSAQSANSLLEAANAELLKEKVKLMESESKLRASETLFRSIFDQATVGIYIGHGNQYLHTIFGDSPAVNPRYSDIAGRTPEEVAALNWKDYTHPEDVKADKENFALLKSGAIASYDMEKRYIKPDGTVVWVHMIMSRLYVHQLSDFSHLCIIEDITKRKAMGQALEDSERSKSVLLSNLPGMAYRLKYDPYWTVEFVSQGCLPLTGYTPESIVQERKVGYFDLILPKYRDTIRRKWEHTLKEKAQFHEEYEIITAAGEIKWVWEQGQGVFDKDGKVLALEGLVMDITERKQQEIKLKYLSEHDPLTGVYNGHHFEEMLTLDIHHHASIKKALLLITLHDLGKVNATHGYVYGESLVKQAAGKLSELWTPSRHLFQIAGDRFIFYVRRYESKADLQKLCRNVIDTLDACLNESRVYGTVGVLELESTQTNVDDILKLASIAAEYAAANQPVRYSFFDRDMEAAVNRKEMIKSELAKCVRSEGDHSLYLVYQPIFHAGTGAIYGFEALARFAGVGTGQVPPGEFIPIAEEAQLIVPLGKKIIRLACGFLKRLETNGITDKVVSINISAIQLLRDDFLPDLLDAVAAAKVNARNITLEITESVFSDSYQKINEKLGAIREKGIAISIDDFGTGYSSLARENELNVSCLKLDKQFIDGLLMLDPGEVIVGDIISMAHKLGHSVVAEGVEREEQRRYLMDHRCDYIQGYLLSRPLPEEQAFQMVM